MSSGHAAAHGDVNELTHLLADPRVRAYLERPWRVVYHPMLLTGGSSVDGSIYYLDPSLQRLYHVGLRAPANLSRFVLLHERIEKALRAVLGMPYPRAHVLATAAERLEVERAGIRWDTYKGVMQHIVHLNEGAHPSFPPGFDLGPVRDYYGPGH